MPNSNGVFPSSLWNQSQVTRTRMVKQEEDESTFDERYTYNHHPFGPTVSFESINGLAWSSSIASTRTADIDKIAIDINSPARHKSIMSMGYLKDANQPFGDINIESLRQPYSFKSGKSGKNSKSSYSIGFFTYVQIRYDRSSRKKKMLIWLFFGVCICLFAISIAVGLSKGQTSKIDPDKEVVEQLSQPENAALEIRDASSDSFLSENGTVLPIQSTTAPATDVLSIADEAESTQFFLNFTTTTITSTDDPTTTIPIDPTSQSQSRDNPHSIDESNKNTTPEPTPV
eukprot:scaffold248282_cov89-Cyclotella_meneghiniana.AAC.2